jgi:hypothetical protein
MAILATVFVVGSQADRSSAGRAFPPASVTSATVTSVATAPSPASTTPTTPTTPTTTTAPTTAPTTVARAAPTTAGTRLAAAVAQPPATAARRTVPVAVPRPLSTVARSAPPVTASGGSSRDFALLGYRWNPCQDITVTTTGPALGGIVSELAAVTGLRLQVVSGPAEITVAWGATPPGGEVGQTLWYAQGAWLVRADIIISPSAPAAYVPTLVRHELGHAMGLSHVQQSNEIMYPYVGPSSPADYQAGDRAGLAAVGASAGC